jgi:hypothetical protein
MIKSLEQILNQLTEAEKQKEIVTRPKNDELGKLFKKDITIYENGNTKKIFIAGEGKLQTYHQKKHLIYRNLSKEIIIKPKEITRYLNENK